MLNPMPAIPHHRDRLKRFVAPAPPAAYGLATVTTPTIMPAHWYQKHEIKSWAITRVASPNLHPVVEIMTVSTDRIKFGSALPEELLAPVFAFGSSLAVADPKSTSETHCRLLEAADRSRSL